MVLTASQISLVVLVQCLDFVQAQDDTPLNTTRATVGWVYGPNYRSTYDIVFSCVLTMGLCVWSALHLNIPAVTDSKARKWFRNAVWVGFGVFAPEGVMFSAYKNYAAAKSLLNAMKTETVCDRCKSQPQEGLEKVRSLSTSDHNNIYTADEKGRNWTMLHGYYAGLGGFVVDLDSDTASAVFNTESDARRLTLTPQGMLLLRECGLVPHIEEREIRDKGNSDGLAKAIVVFQAGWLIVQCVARLAYSLPVTLLEVNTIGHVICALFIYALWWKKPREIEEPTIISGSWIPALTAYMIMSGDTEELEGWREWMTLRPPLLPELSGLVFERALSVSSTSPSPGVSKSSTAISVDADPVAASKSAIKKGFGSLRQLEANKSMSTKRQKTLLHHADQPGRHVGYQKTRWLLALDAMALFPHLCCRLDDLQKAVNSDPPTYKSQVMLQPRARNWPNAGSIPEFQGKIVGMALWFATVTYGVIHISAWNEYFPSVLERWLWRTCAIFLAYSGALWLTINFLGFLSSKFSAAWDLALTGQAHKAVYIILVPVCAVHGIAYAFARLFLVVEAIISLRKMPPSMYVTPNWPQVIPHL